MFKIDANKIKDGKNEVNFLPMCVFDERKPRKIFWRGARRIILFVDGCLEAMRFDQEKGVLQLLQLAWTKEEAREYLFKLEALAQTDVKPIKTWQFFMIILLQIVMIALLLRGVAFPA